MSTHNPPAGRFEQSFMFHMIRDFFLLAHVVAGVELGIRYAVVRYDFSRNEPERVDRAAQQLANDVKSIMLNSGGPTAAQGGPAQQPSGKPARGLAPKRAC